MAKRAPSPCWGDDPTTNPELIRHALVCTTNPMNRSTARCSRRSPGITMPPYSRFHTWKYTPGPVTSEQICGAKLLSLATYLVIFLAWLLLGRLFVVLVTFIDGKTQEPGLKGGRKAGMYAIPRSQRFNNSTSTQVTYIRWRGGGASLSRSHAF